MLRKTATSLFFIILCVVICSAQNYIDSATYEKYVDYVNCYYTTKYIEKTKDKIKNNNYVTDFNRYKEAFDKKVETPLDIDKRYAEKATSTIFQVLQKTVQGYYVGNKNRAIILWDEIEKKKSSFDTNWNKDEIVKNLIALPTNKLAEGNGVNFDSFLEKEQNELKSNLEKLLPKQEGEKIENTQNVEVEEIKETNKEIIQPEAEQNNTNSTLTEVASSQQEDNIKNGKAKSVAWGKLLIFVVVIAIIGAIIWKRKWLKDKILFCIDKLSKKENEPDSGIQNNPEQNTPAPKPETPQKITLQPKDFERVFNWILKSDNNFEKFSKYILQNEQLLSLWLQKSMNYPTIRKEIEKHFTPKEIIIIKEKADSPMES